MGSESTFKFPSNSSDSGSSSQIYLVVWVKHSLIVQFQLWHAITNCKNRSNVPSMGSESTFKFPSGNSDTIWYLPIYLVVWVKHNLASSDFNSSTQLSTVKTIQIYLLWVVNLSTM